VEAQECLDRAREATAAGDISGAIALLRRALALAPRDAEISAELGALAFRDRIVT
jgi:Flp pilus assembly protein TadD